MGNGQLRCCESKDLKQRILEQGEALNLYERLRKLVDRRPYLQSPLHPLNVWVQSCFASLEALRLDEAADHLGRIDVELKIDDKRLRAAFEKFDVDSSGKLEIGEFRHFCTYIGFGSQAADQVLADNDRDRDGVISLDEFSDFVGRHGGVHHLFETRRRAMHEESGHDRGYHIEVGSRVRAYFYTSGKQSKAVWDARVLELNEDGKHATLEFGMGQIKRNQEIPRDWIESDVDLVEAFRGIGMFDDSQLFWTILTPPSEQQSVKMLNERQANAISHVRVLAMNSHAQALPRLTRRCKGLGVSDEGLWAVLTWIRDLAPIIIHVDLDKIGKFLEHDTHYRNQFETKTSNGLLDEETRNAWERDLYGGTYSGAAPFHRPKYGVLDVMNDHRGVVCARQYGDSYITLKNVRLRCTFAPEDSGGICGSRLAVLDQFAHVLQEFSDEELMEVARVAGADVGCESRIGTSAKLGEYRYKEAQIHGDVQLKRDVRRLVVHPRHRVDGWDENRIRKLCEKHAWEFCWMDDERTRRIRDDKEYREGMQTLPFQINWLSGELDHISEAPDEAAIRRRENMNRLRTADATEMNRAAAARGKPVK